MDAFAWGVIGSVAGVIAAAAAIIALLPRPGWHKEIPAPPDQTTAVVTPVAAIADIPIMVGEIPREPLGFQPRTDLLAALDAHGAGSRVVVVHALTGLRGVGKTHLAASYARAKGTERWRLVAWINAEDLGGILAGLAEVASALGLGPRQPDAEGAARAVRHRLETDGDHCLLVFDNAADPELLQSFIPATGAARVIITSNHLSMANLGTGVPIDVFTEDQALAFLTERTGSTDTQGAGAVAAELGYLPLALAQAAAVITAQHLGYATYLDRLRALPVGELLQPVEAGQYPRGVAASVLLSLENVQSSDDTAICAALIGLLAVLSAAGVSRTLVYEAARLGVLSGDGQAAEVADRALAWLANASLLTFSVDGSSVSTHRLVMRVIREQLATDGSLTAVCAGAAELLDGLAESLSQTWHQDVPAARDLVEQIMALAKSCTEYPVESDLVRRTMELRWWALWFLVELADSQAQAIMIGEPLLADQESILGPDDYDTLATRNSLAIAYQQAGRITDAITLAQQALAAMEHNWGRDHPDTLVACGSLAIAYHENGRTAEAITLYEQTLAAQERILGPDHPSTLKSRNNLAAAYRNTGRTAEAITMQQQTLAARERILGPDHPDTLGSRGNLAAAYLDAGRTAEAINMQQQALSGLERVLGPDHPETVVSHGNLAAAHRDAGRTAEAISLYKQTLAARERVLGPDHPDTVVARSDLAAAYRDAGGVRSKRRKRNRQPSDP